MLRIVENTNSEKVAVNVRHVVQVTANRNRTARIWLASNGASSSIDTKADFDDVVALLNGENY